MYHLREWLDFNFDVKICHIKFGKGKNTKIWCDFEKIHHLSHWSKNELGANIFLLKNLRYIPAMLGRGGDDYGEEDFL